MFYFLLLFLVKSSALWISPCKCIIPRTHYSKFTFIFGKNEGCSAQNLESLSQYREEKEFSLSSKWRTWDSRFFSIKMRFLVFLFISFWSSSIFYGFLSSQPFLNVIVLINLKHFFHACFYNKLQINKKKERKVPFNFNIIIIIIVII